MEATGNEVSRLSIEQSQCFLSGTQAPHWQQEDGIRKELHAVFGSGNVLPFPLLVLSLSAAQSTTHLSYSPRPGLAAVNDTVCREALLLNSSVQSLHQAVH